MAEVGTFLCTATYAIAFANHQPSSATGDGKTCDAVGIYLLNVKTMSWVKSTTPPSEPSPPSPLTIGLGVGTAALTCLVAAYVFIRKWRNRKALKKANPETWLEEVISRAKVKC